MRMYASRMYTRINFRLLMVMQPPNFRYFKQGLFNRQVRGTAQYLPSFARMVNHPLESKTTYPVYSPQKSTVNFQSCTQIDTVPCTWSKNEQEAREYHNKRSVCKYMHMCKGILINPRILRKYVLCNAH